MLPPLAERQLSGRSCHRTSGCRFTLGTAEEAKKIHCHSATRLGRKEGYRCPLTDGPWFPASDGIHAFQVPNPPDGHGLELWRLLQIEEPLSEVPTMQEELATSQLENGELQAELKELKASSSNY